MSLLDDLDRRRERVANDKENSARLAQSYAEFTTTGLGSIQHNKRVKFGTTFVEKPHVSYGCIVDINDLADKQDLEDEDLVILPLCTGYVTEWDQDDRGFYTGCWIAVRVYYPTELSSGSTPVEIIPCEDPEVEHHFTFSAIAMKDIPTDTTDATD